MHRGEIRNSTTPGNIAEVIHAAVVHSERGRERQIVEVDSELGVVAADGPGKIVGELIAIFDTLDERVRLVPGVSIANDVDGWVISGGDGLVVEIRQTPAGILETKFIHLAIADGPGVLKNAGYVTVGLLRSTRLGVLTEGLVLAVDFDAGHRAGADIGAKRQAVVVGKVVVQAQ